MTSIHTIWIRVAPRARICSLRLAGRLCRAPTVMPMTIGVAMIDWAMMMAVGV